MEGIRRTRKELVTEFTPTVAGQACIRALSRDRAKAQEDSKAAKAQLDACWRGVGVRVSAGVASVPEGENDYNVKQNCLLLKLPSTHICFFSDPYFFPNPPPILPQSIPIAIRIVTCFMHHVNALTQLIVLSSLDDVEKMLRPTDYLTH